MSDNPQQRRNGELKVSDDVWLAVSTTEWALGDLEVHRSEDGTGAQIVIRKGDSIERLPIPQGPPPAKLISFNYMEIFYTNDTVIAFLRHFVSDVGVTLQMEIRPGAHRSWDIFVQQIWPLLSSNINAIDLIVDTIRELRSRVSPTVLCDCANLRSICASLLPLEWPADDRREASDGQALTKWIHTPREDGLPKTFLHYGPMLSDTVVTGFRKTFLNASTAANYIIVVTGEEAPADYVPFEEKNEQTWERLAFRRQDEHVWLMERGPILRDEKQWTEWKKEAVEGIHQKNVIVVFVDEI
uniref:Uncharacterized protein n=2 Tax=Globodera pallida TaxID=36090 RepID=A0A183C2X1_GLOPA